MKLLASSYTFSELIDLLKSQPIEHDGREQYTFVPVQYRGK